MRSAEDSERRPFAVVSAEPAAAAAAAQLQPLETSSSALELSSVRRTTQSHGGKTLGVSESLLAFLPKAAREEGKAPVRKERSSDVQEKINYFLETILNKCRYCQLT